MTREQSIVAQTRTACFARLAEEGRKQKVSDAPLVIFFGDFLLQSVYTQNSSQMDYGHLMKGTVPQDTNRPGYIPAIDGLRTVAIGSVILFHLQVPGTALGWAGVPIFFAISGFLITRLLLSRKEDAATFSAFYWDFIRRRVLRIFPLYYAYLLVSTISSHLYSEPFSDQWSYWVYLQNYTLGFSKFSNSYILGQTWSLALEEQFYLLWPLIVWCCSVAALKRLCWILVLLGPVTRWAVCHWSNNSYLAFTTLPSCVDLLAMGAILALWSEADWIARKNIFVVMFVAAAAFLAIAFPYASYWQPTLYIPATMGPLVFSAVGVCSVSLLGIALNNGILARLLSMPVMTYLGRISYGIYMFHAFFLLRASSLIGRFPGDLGYVAWCVAVIAGSIAAAAISYKFFESFFLHLKNATQVKMAPSSR
ncbi:MAG: acyltransferase [Xanthobacteraceae bacterium]|nr:acyltransferase [Xanthobacteraceae bacterium]